MAYASKQMTKDGVKPIGSNLYGICTTAGNAITKVVNMPDFDVLIPGVTIHVLFSNMNTAASPKLQVGSTEDIEIKCNGRAAGIWGNGSAVSFTYDGESWRQNDAAGAFVDFFYPIGAYFETSDTTFDPNIQWGGTWVLEAEGQVHVSAGGGYAVTHANDNSGMGASDGGEASHVLTPAETAMKNHSHTIDHGHTLDHPYIPDHTHKLNAPWSNYGGGGSDAYVLQNNRYLQDRYTYNDGGGGQTYGGSVADYSGSSGGQAESNGSAHNNMQPYIVVNRWHRTA